MVDERGSFQSSFNICFKMFDRVKNLFVAEHPSSWKEPEVIEWMEKSANHLKAFYLNYAGKQWDKYCMENNEDLKLLLAKICYACFGDPPNENAQQIWDGYSEDQQKSAQELVDLMVDVPKKHLDRPWLYVSIIFICGKQKENEFLSPIFSVCTSENVESETANRVYIDLQRRTYNSWEDWRKNNTLPMLKYACPRFGYFTCSENGQYEFDPHKDPQLEFHTTPACDLVSRAAGLLDFSSSIAGLASTLVLAATLFTPIGPITAGSAAVAGTCASIYGTGRAANRLVDKKDHGENLTDLESLTIYLNLLAAPLALGQGAVNATLAKGAVQGRIFSQSYRTFATILNFGKLGIDGLLIGCGFANLVEKSKQDSLTTFDVLQFSMSVFFFTNTLIQPKVASAIIEKAQQKYIQSYADNLTDQGTKDTFQRFLQANQESGSIKDTSKIIRCINRMNDPDSFFSSQTNAQEIKIGGRKGRTVLVTNETGQTMRINPSRLRAGPFNHPTVIPQVPITETDERTENISGPEFAKQKQDEYADEYYGESREKAAQHIKSAWTLYRQRQGTEEDEDTERREENSSPATANTGQSIGQNRTRMDQDLTTITPRIEVYLGEFSEEQTQDGDSIAEENEEAVLIKINSSTRIIGILFKKDGYYKVYVSRLPDNFDWTIQLIRESFWKWALKKFHAIIPIFIFMKTECEDYEEPTSGPDQPEDQA